MGRDDLRIHIPSYFRCPISLEIMKSPVSLCTGVTYDRSSIQLWLDSGNNTCPATMQVLQSKELIPNHTLHRLINVWSSASLPPPSAVPVASHHPVVELVNQLEIHLRSRKPQLSVVNRNLSKLTSFVSEKEGNGKIVATAGKRILPLLLAIIGRVTKEKDTVLLEKVFLVCNVLLKYSGESVCSIGKEDYRSVVNCLKKGRFESRIAVVKFLGLIESNPVVVEDDEVYSELLKLISISNSDRNLEALEACVSLLIRFVTSPKRNRVKMVKLGGVKVLSKTLSEAELSPELTEKMLKLIEMASCCKEGRIAMVSDENCVPAIVKKLLKVSSAATEHSVTILWSLCCLFREKRAVEMAGESNGMARVLVVLQSNCSPAVRQMCGDLLRVLGCNSKTSSTLSCYDTKTTHIMPF